MQPSTTGHYLTRYVTFSVSGLDFCHGKTYFCHGSGKKTGKNRQ